MNIIHSIQDWATDFFGLKEAIRIIQSGDYNALKTLNGILSIVGPILPIVLVFEFLIACLYRKLKIIDYKIPFFSYVMNALTIGRFISIAAVAYIIGLLSSHAILNPILPGTGLFMDISFGNLDILFIIFLHIK